MAEVRAQFHRVDCIPLQQQGSGAPQYSLWLHGRMLMQQTSQPMVDAKDKLQRLGYTGHIELWSVDKPYLIRVEPLH